MSISQILTLPALSYSQFSFKNSAIVIIFGISTYGVCIAFNFIAIFSFPVLQGTMPEYRTDRLQSVLPTKRR